ncbi:MAG: hypothetical protein ABIV43_00090 [Candidatus Saccharimonadales bacterium]
MIESERYLTLLLHMPIADSVRVRPATNNTRRFNCEITPPKGMGTTATPKFHQAVDLLVRKLELRMTGGFYPADGITRSSVSWLFLKGASIDHPSIPDIAGEIGNTGDWAPILTTYIHHEHRGVHYPSNSRQRIYPIGQTVLLASEIQGYGDREPSGTHLSLHFPLNQADQEQRDRALFYQLLPKEAGNT